MSKIAICTTEKDAKAIQAADDAAGHLPWPSVYLDGRPCPGIFTLHRYDVTAKPDGKAFAFPVDDTYAAKAGVTVTDKLDASWTAETVEPKEPAGKEVVK
ncbi:MAG: hypothetical protein WC683_09500 [bacterium]|jgi:hypothetical protein